MFQCSQSLYAQKSYHIKFEARSRGSVGKSVIGSIMRLWAVTAGKVQWNWWFQNDYLMISCPKESVLDLWINFEQKGNVFPSFCTKCTQNISWSDSKFILAWNQAGIEQKCHKLHSMCPWSTKGRTFELKSQETHKSHPELILNSPQIPSWSHCDQADPIVIKLLLDHLITMGLAWNLWTI